MFGRKKEDKKAQEPKSIEQPKIETAVLLSLFENGGGTVVHTGLTGIKTLRTATMKDIYRMVCEVKGNLEVMMTTDRIVSALQTIAKPSTQVSPLSVKPDA